MLAGREETGSCFWSVNRLFITGGSGGLGRAVCNEFSSHDWQIIAPEHESLDVSMRDQVESCMNQDGVDLLVCAAGITRDARLVGLKESEWDEVFAVNYQGALNCARAVLPTLVAQGKGHLVFVSSYSALHPPLGQVAYATSKAALLGLTTSLAGQYGRHGIRVNVILPGFLETSMTATVSDTRKEEVLAAHTLGRFNTPEVVARFIRFLHENLPETSGQVFQLDSRIP